MHQSRVKVDKHFRIVHQQVLVRDSLIANKDAPDSHFAGFSLFGRQICGKRIKHSTDTNLHVLRVQIESQGCLG